MFSNLYITGFSTEGVCIDVVFLLWVYLHCGSNQNRQKATEKAYIYKI